MKKIFASAVVIGSCLVGLAATAFAHAEFDPATATAGAPATLTISVPNESSTAKTIKVELLVPAECTGCVVTPVAPTGWTAAVAGSTITWSGGTISGTDRVAFSFDVNKLPATPGKLVFKAVQTYDNGDTVRWVEAPLADGSEPAHPAPTVELVANGTPTTTAPPETSTSVVTTAPTVTTTAPVSTTTVPAVITTTVAPPSAKTSSSSGATIAIIIGAVAILGVGAFLFMKKKAHG